MKLPVRGIALLSLDPLLDVIVEALQARDSGVGD